LKLRKLKKTEEEEWWKSHAKELADPPDPWRHRARDTQAARLTKKCKRCNWPGRAERSRQGERYVRTDPRLPELKTRHHDPESTRGVKGYEGFQPEYRKPLVNLWFAGSIVRSRLAFDHWDGYRKPGEWWAPEWPNPCVWCGGSGVIEKFDFPWQTGPRAHGLPNDTAYEDGRVVKLYDEPGYAQVFADDERKVVRNRRQSGISRCPRASSTSIARSLSVSSADVRLSRQLGTSGHLTASCTVGSALPQTVTLLTKSCNTKG
jgi:hypothetical protein